jgi:hypothetical protein
MIEIGKDPNLMRTKFKRLHLKATFLIKIIHARKWKFWYFALVFNCIILLPQNYEEHAFCKKALW